MHSSLICLNIGIAEKLGSVSPCNKNAVEIDRLIRDAKKIIIQWMENEASGGSKIIVSTTTRIA